MNPIPMRFIVDATQANMRSVIMRKLENFKDIPIEMLLTDTDFSRVYHSYANALPYLANIVNLTFTDTSMFPNVLVGMYEDVSFLTCVFENTQFTRSFLLNSAFNCCKFSYTAFTKSVLTRASFYNCTFTGVDFTEAMLESSYFYACKFIRCRFHNTDLSNAKFDDIIVEDTDFSRAYQHNTTFGLLPSDATFPYLKT